MTRRPHRSICHNARQCRGRHFIGPHPKGAELVDAECGRKCHIRRITAPRHQNPANTWDVVAGIESMPLSAQINFKPGTEIHWRRLPRHANIAEITGAVPCWNIERSAKRDGQVHVIATDPGPLAKHFERRAIGPRLHVVEADMLVDVVAYRLDEWPASR